MKLITLLLAALLVIGCSTPERSPVSNTTPAPVERAEPVPAPEPEPEPAPEPVAEPQFEYNDVQIRKSVIDSFDVRARLTNTGGDAQGVYVTATLFNNGSMVGVATRRVGYLGAGQTVTVELLSTDTYQQFDEIEFVTEWR